MRLFEIALIVGEVLTFGLLMAPRLRPTRWPVVAGLVTAAIAVAQSLVEGARWQMLPAYALTVLLLAAFLLWRFAPRYTGWPIRRRSAAGTMVVVAALGLTASVGLPLAIPMFSFATPTGPYAIGTLTYDWVDQKRADFGDPAQKRELMVQIWYPARPAPQAQPDTYIQNDMRFGPLPGTPFPAFFSTHLNAIRTHALKGTPVATSGGDFRFWSSRRERRASASTTPSRWRSWSRTATSSPGSIIREPRGRSSSRTGGASSSILG